MISRSTAIILAFVFLAMATAGAVDIGGKVTGVSGEIVSISIDSQIKPKLGDSVKIYFLIPGSQDEVDVASGKVTEIRADSTVAAKIEKSSGKAAKDQLVRINTTAEVAVPPTRDGTAIAEPKPAKPTGDGQAKEEPPVGDGVTVLRMDALEAGSLALNAFAAQGIEIVKGKGDPALYDITPNMVLPEGQKRVLLLGGANVTSLTLRFKTPVTQFSLVRIGTRGGASVPTWTMVAMDGQGKVLDSTGEIHGLPTEPKKFTVKAGKITSIQLKTDNRNGAGTWATWSSLPVSAIDFTPLHYVNVYP